MSYTTAGHHGNTVKRSVGGVSGILKKLQEFKNNKRIFGYIDDVVIQPLLLSNREASVVCFDGEPKFRNPHKGGHKGQRSPFPRSTKDSVFFDYARRVIREVRSACPELIADQILRVDFFGERLPDGTIGFLVNEIESLEARLWGLRTTAGTRLAEVENMVEEYWYEHVDTLIECHVQLRS